MKSQLVLFALFLSVTPLPAQEPGTAPAYWFENVPAGDDSIQSSLVFRTIPGVQYTVETSHDLTTWTELDAIYGMGHEFVTPMRQFTPPPPLPPGTPPPTPWPPTRMVSLRMTPSSATAGGTVVSWISLDDHTARMTLLPESLHSQWAWLPLFSGRYGAYYFFVGHPLASIPPPVENPELGPLDAAMIATLQTSLAAMNQRVADSIARARNSPPPAPPDPLSKKFWRIKADWGLDSDADGSPDWVEFAAAAANPAGVAGLRADAFDADTDHNAVLDGSQLDSDNDGIPDLHDVDHGGPGNAQDGHLVNWQRTPGFRFAAFEVPVELAPGETLGIDDLSPNGTVLYTKIANGNEWARFVVDSNLVRHPVPAASAPGPDGFWSYANALIGDGVLGTWTVEGPTPGSTQSEGVVWNPLDDSHEPYFFIGYDDDILDARDAFRVVQHSPNIPYLLVTPTGPLADSQDHQGRARIEERGNIVSTNGYWRCNPAGPVYGARVALPEPAAARSASFIRRAVLRADPAQSLHFWNLVAGSSCLLISDNQGAFAKSAITYGANQHPVGVTSQGWLATDQAVWNYDQWTPLSQLLGVVGTVDQALLSDMVDNGLAVADIKTRTFAKTCLLVPIIADGVDTDPLTSDNEDSAGGVDRLSMTAPFGGSGKTSQIWLMAPNSPPPPQTDPAPAPLVNAVRIRAPLNDKTTLLFRSNSKVEFPAAALTAHDQTIQIKGLGTDTATTTPSLKLADRQLAVNGPIGVVAMKKRVVKVAVHVVTGRDGTGANTTPKFTPTIAAMETALNKVYGRQVNTTFELLPLITEDGTNHNGIDFDIDSPNAHDGFVNVGTIETTDADNHPIWIVGPELTLATPNAKSTATPATANIDVWVLGGVTLKLEGEPVYGAHFGKQFAGTVVIDGDLMGVTGTADTLTAIFCHVLEHEIGHVMIGNGHPDRGQGDAVLRWVPARQASTRPTMDPRDQQRLMCSGPGTNWDQPGKQLIYKEWSLIEAWLKREEERLNQSL